MDGGLAHIGRQGAVDVGRCMRGWGQELKFMSDNLLFSIN